MAYTARLVGRDATLLEYDGVSVLSTFRRADIDITVETVDTTAVMDSGRDFRPTHYTWTVSFSKLKEAGNPMWLQKLQQSNFEDVSFEVVIDGRTIKGWCTYQRVSNPIGEEAQTDEVTFQGRRELYIDGQPIEIGPIGTANPPIPPPP